ncbi:phosphatidylethanolamine-binding protein 2 [Aphelenchoides avenae]|nr:phosphatidylethanolamine-binding protein 2 [Aphelenchus avenae]
MMVDPDAPFASEPFWRSWVHWLAVNMPGAQLAKGELVQNYTAPFPHPSADKGLHRYVFLVYQQRGPVTGDYYGPAAFNVQAFVKLHKLIQPPAAGNFFRA